MPELAPIRSIQQLGRSRGGNRIHRVTGANNPERPRRLNWFEKLGFDEALLVSHAGVLEDIERARDFL